MQNQSQIQSIASQLTTQIQNQILQAEGLLNRQVQHSLTEFRRKLNQQLNDKIRRKIDKENYDISKEGVEKSFKFRQSLLSIRFEVADIKTIYNMAVASFAILSFCLIYDNYTKYGQFIDGSEFTKVFYGWQKVFISLCFLSLSFYSIIFITKFALGVHLCFWVPLYLFYLVGIFYYAYSIVKKQQLGFGSTVIIMAQAVRIMMKSHSYLRTKLLYCNPNQYQNFKLHSNNINDKRQKNQKLIIKMQDFFLEVKRLSYFFFAPTLIYRDQYTLTAKRNLRKIIVHFINFMFCTYYGKFTFYLAFILYIVSCKPTIQNLQKKLDLSTFVLTVIRLMLPSVCFLILGFFGFLHSWLNAWSQITRFPDRAFYSDWWNSIQFGSYYRKWNIVVHDFLYYYIYLDLCRFFSVCRQYKVIPKLLTFFISAVIHQLIIWVSIGFFYPILFILFTGPGIILIQNQNKLKAISINLLFWIEMYIGTAMLFSFYLVQSFARKTISQEFMIKQWGSLEPLIPRTLYLGQNI